MPEYCVVAVHEGEEIYQKCVKSIKQARSIMKKEAMQKMKRKKPTGDGFIELREMGDFEYGNFESIDNIWAEDIYG